MSDFTTSGGYGKQRKKIWYDINTLLDKKEKRGANYSHLLSVSWYGKSQLPMYSAREEWLKAKATH